MINSKSPKERHSKGLKTRNYKNTILLYNSIYFIKIPLSITQRNIFERYL